MEKLETKDLVPAKKDCCGCGLCQIKCPVEAIAMRVDREGFLYPMIKKEHCIGCRKCIKSCIMRINKISKKEH